MKIRKKEPSVGILGKIINLFSNSQQDTYSCDYINKALEEHYSTEGTIGADDVYDLGSHTIHMQVNKYDEENNHTVSIVDLSLLNWSLNDAKSKYENGKISKVKTKFTFVEVVLENEEPILTDQVTYDLEFIPCKYLDGLSEEEIFSFNCQTSRYSLNSEIQVKHLFQMFSDLNNGNWALICITDGLNIQMM